MDFYKKLALICIGKLITNEEFITAYFPNIHAFNTRIIIDEDIYIDIYNDEDDLGRRNIQSTSHDYKIFIKIIIHDYLVFTSFIGFDDNQDKNNQLEEMIKNKIYNGDLSTLKSFFLNLEYTYVDKKSYYNIPNWFKEEINSLYNEMQAKINSNFKQTIIQKIINQRIFIPNKDEKFKEQICFILYKYLEQYLKDKEIKEISPSGEKRALKIIKQSLLPILDIDENQEKVLSLEWKSKDEEFK